LRDKIDEIHATGAELIIVGNGQTSFAKGFKNRLQLTTPLYVDPELQAYQAAGLKRTKFGTIGPQVFFPALKAFFRGQRQGRVEGDPYQQGGGFVILPGDKVAYAYVNKRSSDRPKIKKILKVLNEAKTRSTAVP
jgi:hypothetical protein